jgi:hypothetical protein
MDRQRIDDLGKKIAGAAAALDRGEHALLTAIRQFDELDGWHYQGHFLWECGFPGASA